MLTQTNESKLGYWPFVLLFAIAYWPLFGHLENLPIIIWDEARHSMNAYEMFHNKNYLVVNFLGSMDSWNTKPPLMAWMQVFWMHLFGPNELALRLPSALAGLFSCFYLLWFGHKVTGKKTVGLVASLAILVSAGMVGIQGTRTGDVNALLCLCLLIANGSFYLTVTTGQKRMLYLWMLATALAVLTKSVAGLLCTPAWLFFLLREQKLLVLLRSRSFYKGLGIFILLVGGYYLTRELTTPGYLQLVYENELGGRLLGSKENHKEPFWYYIRLLWEWQMPQKLVILAGVSLVFTRGNKLGVFLVLAILCQWLIVSVSATKLSTYFMPSFALIALLIGLFISRLLKPGCFRWVLVLILFVPYYGMYKQQVNTWYKPQVKENEKEFYTIGYHLRNQLKKGGSNRLQGRTVAFHYSDNHALLYMRELKRKGIELYGKHISEVEENDKLLVFESACFKELEKEFEYQIEHKEDGVFYVALKRKDGP